jgi:predicted kinase
MYILLMRGCPSSGKSYLANKILEEKIALGKTAVIRSTDNYWYLEDGTYKFDINKLSIAHKWNQLLCREDAENKIQYIIIDNTNLKFKDILPYLNIAKEFGYDVGEVIPDTPWMQDAQECFKRNAHNVPFEVIERMQKTFRLFPSLKKRINEYCR